MRRPPSYLDKTTNEWKDGDPLFLACTIWRQAAEHVAESLTRGARVIVTGRLKQRSYETREGEKRTVIELEVDEVGPSLRYATAKVNKMTRSAGNGTSSRGTDEWSSASPARTTATPAGGSFDDEPPF